MLYHCLYYLGTVSEARMGDVMGEDGGGFTLVDLKELSKVANNFINKVSKGMGLVYEPRHVRRMAEAKADAKIIAAEADE